MNITFWPLERIIPYGRNARKIPPTAVDKVAASIQEFGWRQPIVVDGKGVIICGHTRLLAAQKLGLKEAPVHVADNLTPAQVRAYRLLDNRSHEETSWDRDLLGLELLDLQGMGVDLDLTGFNTEELDRYLARGGGLCDEDAVPEVRETAVSAPGDLWLLGRHRLLCGDATVAASYERVLTGRRADMTFTDPPYGVDYVGKTKQHLKLQNDHRGSHFEILLRDACANLLEVTEGAVYICMSSSELDTLKKAFTTAGGHWSTFIIWAKNTFTLGRSDYQRQYEPILYGWGQGRGHYWCGARDQGDVWCIDRPQVNDLHPTMKPVALVERALGNSSRSGDTVLDPFGGSGSTLIGCEKTGREARLIELDPRYIDTAVVRWQEFTGAEAVLEEDGRSFRKIIEERRGAEWNGVLRGVSQDF
jgi:DNA modification methylase